MYNSVQVYVYIVYMFGTKDGVRNECREGVLYIIMMEEE